MVITRSSYWIVPTLRSPLPVIFDNIPGSAGCCAFAAGTMFQKRFPGVAALARLAGTGEATRLCKSATLALSTFSVNCTCGAAKFLKVSAPFAFDWPTDIATFSRIAEFWLKRMSEFRICSGLVREGTFNTAFWIFPVPLKVNAAGFFVGPCACTSAVNDPSPVMPSTAEIP